MPSTGNRRLREEGFAILMVILVLVGLAIIGAPFAISMRQEEQASVSFAARVRARLAAQAALNFALAQLEKAHEAKETENANASSRPLTIFNSPFVDSSGEFRVDLQDRADGLLSTWEIANPAGVIWGVKVTDEQGKVNLKTASRALLFNLLSQLPTITRPGDIADAIIQYRDVNRKSFTTLTQLREITIAGTSPRLTAAEFDRMAPFLTVHSASIVGDVPSRSLALHPINLNTCSDEVLRAALLGLRIAKQAGDAANPVGLSQTEVDAVVSRLRVVHSVDPNGTGVSAGAGSVTLDSVDRLPASGWVSIEGDAVKYTGIITAARSLTVPDPTQANSYLPICARVDVRHAAGAEVRLLFTDIEHDLAGVLDAMVSPPSPTLRSEARSAILANAINPRNSQVFETNTTGDPIYTTAPFCLRSFNIYTIEAHGVSNAADGRELARYTIREIAQVSTSGDLELKVDTQEDFERSRQAGIASHVATWPNATQVSDFPPAGIEPTDPSLFDHKGRIGLQPAEYSPAGTTSFVARFHGPLRRNALNGEILYPADPHRADYYPLDPAFPTVKVDPGDDTDLDPEGIYVGEVPSRTEKRVLAYVARNDVDPSKSNIPHTSGYVNPFVLEMWVKFDSRFDYSKDHFLFDLAEATFTNRVALFYDSTSATGGDLVLHVSGPTVQKTPAQIRHAITDATFEPHRWYHVAFVVKGTDYGQMALFIDGQSVGAFQPSGALAGLDAASVTCTGWVARYSDTQYFPTYSLPAADCAIIDGELVEFTDVTYVGDVKDPKTQSTQLTVGTEPLHGRGARGTATGNHGAGSHVDLYGYDNPLNVPMRGNDTEFPTAFQTNLPLAADMPTLRAGESIPAQLATATLADAPIVPGSTTDPPTTWTPTAYGVPGTLANDPTHNRIPGVLYADWFPIATSEYWTVADNTVDPESHASAAGCRQAVADRMQGFLTYNDTGQDLISSRIIEDTAYGLGLLRVERNGSGPTGEIIKYAQAGVVVVWAADPDDSDHRRMRAWYIGYLAGFGITRTTPNPPNPPTVTSIEGRGCFGTATRDSQGNWPAVNAGATLRFDCLRLTDYLALPRGHREAQSGWPGDPPTFHAGRGVFQLYHDTATYEWIEFEFPQFVQGTTNPNELDLLDCLQGNGKLLAGIHRSFGNTGPTPGTRDEHVGFAFTSADSVMPVFFGATDMYLMDQHLAILPGRGDAVTLTDSTNQTLALVLSHGYVERYSSYLAFRTHLTSTFATNNRPRVLKFPSGHLPLRPDRLFYIGSDAVCHDGQSGSPFTELGTNRSAVGANPEPERPANATFDEIKIYPAGKHGTARLWDFQLTPGITTRNTATTTIAAGQAPPFCIRIGKLERLTRSGQGAAAAFSLVANGDVVWPAQGCLKIDNECFFYRRLYYGLGGVQSARLVSSSAADSTTGIAVALGGTDSQVLVDFNQGKDFPSQGYITISGAKCPIVADWTALVAAAAALGMTPAQFLQQFGNGGRSFYAGIDFPERMFYDSKTVATAPSGEQVWALHLAPANRRILDSKLADDSRQVVRFVPPGTTPPSTWFVNAQTERGGADVKLIAVELLILQRGAPVGTTGVAGCMGTVAADHRIGTVLLPIDHIPTSLAPRPMVKFRRDPASGKLPRLASNPNVLQPLDDNDSSFRLSDPGYEYGIVVESVRNDDGNVVFPTEGYVQIGNEIFAYIQDRDGGTAGDPTTGTAIWNAAVSVRDDAQDRNVTKILPVLTGIRDFRQRFGSGRAAYMEPGSTGALPSIDPGIPDPNLLPTDPNYATYQQPKAVPAYAAQNARHIVRSIAFRYHDRLPLRATAGPTGPTDPDPTGGYGPHWNDIDQGYYEFAVTIPGARWTSVHWGETLWRSSSSGTWTLDDTRLAHPSMDGNNRVPGDPFDIKVLAQIDGSPGWDDTATDPALILLDKDGGLIDANPQPVSTPIYWSNLYRIAGAYNSDAASHRPRIPVIHLFDYPIADNFINPIMGTTTLQPRGQNGDRIRLRVYFQYRPNAASTSTDPVPFYQIPWRTPWVDWITIGYRAPTAVLEHREMPY